MPVPERSNHHCKGRSTARKAVHNTVLAIDGPLRLVSQNQSGGLKPSLEGALGGKLSLGSAIKEWKRGTWLEDVLNLRHALKPVVVGWLLVPPVTLQSNEPFSERGVEVAEV